MRMTHALLGTVLASLSATLLFAGAAYSGGEAIGGDSSRVATPAGEGGVTAPQPSTPLYPSPAPGLPSNPPGTNPAVPPPPGGGQNPGTPPGANPGANPGLPGNAPGMNPGAGHGTPGAP
jgi:hypothetical protein